MHTLMGRRMFRTRVVARNQRGMHPPTSSSPEDGVEAEVEVSYTLQSIEASFPHKVLWGEVVDLQHVANLRDVPV